VVGGIQHIFHSMVSTQISMVTLLFTWKALPPGFWCTHGRHNNNQPLAVFMVFSGRPVYSVNSDIQLKTCIKVVGITYELITFNTCHEFTDQFMQKKVYIQYQVSW